MKSRTERFKAWLKVRPASIRVTARTIKPKWYYVIKSTGQIVEPYSFSENGTVTVTVVGGSLFPGLYQVFDLKPYDLRRATLRELANNPPMHAVVERKTGTIGSMTWHNSFMKLVPAWRAPKRYVKATQAKI